MSIQTSTLRPGFLVSLKSSVTGNVQYSSEEIVADHVAEETGARVAKWQTERVIADPEEHENAIKVRSKCRSLITSICTSSAFGLLCPEGAGEALSKAIAQAREKAVPETGRVYFLHAGRIVAVARPTC